MSAEKAVTFDYPEKFGSNPDECARGDLNLLKKMEKNIYIFLR